MWLLKYGIILIFFSFKVANSQLFVGSYCTLQLTESLGECKYLSNCQTAIDNWTFRKLMPKICGYVGDRMVVCCLTNKNTPIRKSGIKAKEKCKEYSKYIYVEREGLLIGDPPFIINECGHRAVKLIVGGSKADRKEFPHMARIGYESSPGVIRWACGGTIISENYILTAAHCLRHPQYGYATVVRIGVAAFNSTSMYKQDIQISKLLRHQQYNATSHYNDIGLIKLAKPAKMNPYARPACLYLNDTIQGNQAIATAWRITENKNDSSNDLLKVTLDVFKNDDCMSSYTNSSTRTTRRRQHTRIRDDLQFCAGVDFDSSSNEVEITDTCRGDSGGPLQIYHTGDNITCMYDIIGISSFGNGCFGDKMVYTRVSHYIGWIENIIWP